MPLAWFKCYKKSPRMPPLPQARSESRCVYMRVHVRACALSPFTHCGSHLSWDCPGPHLRTLRCALQGRSTGCSSLLFLQSGAEGLSSRDLPKHRPRCSQEWPHTCPQHAGPATCATLAMRMFTETPL